jgi:hypothetical protein
MPDKAQQKHRTNRVFKSLHKPLTYLGVERTLFYFVCVGAVGAFNLFNSILAGIAVFIGGFAFGHWITRKPSPRLTVALLRGRRPEWKLARDDDIAIGRDCQIERTQFGIRAQPSRLHRCAQSKSHYRVITLSVRTDS